MSFVETGINHHANLKVLNKIGFRRPWQWVAGQLFQPCSTHKKNQDSKNISSLINVTLAKPDVQTFVRTQINTDNQVASCLERPHIWSLNYEWLMVAAGLFELGDSETEKVEGHS